MGAEVFVFRYKVGTDKTYKGGHVEHSVGDKPFVSQLRDTIWEVVKDEFETFGGIHSSRDLSLWLPDEKKPEESRLLEVHEELSTVFVDEPKKKVSVTSFGAEKWNAPFVARPVSPSGDSAKLPAASPSFQSFVQGARESYNKYQSGSKFLEVRGHPFEGYADAFLIWVRKCYVDMREILERETRKRLGGRFILLGTAGIGKSLFTVFWVCYLATMMKRVVWKLSAGCFLLDFRRPEAATVQGPANDLTPHDLQDVLNDEDSWLVIDAKQETGLNYRCRILLACSAKPANYKEFGKDRRAQKRYFPIWTKNEIEDFCDDFKEYNGSSEFSDMDVPEKADAVANFEILGGVPRYVLCVSQADGGIDDLDKAVGAFQVDKFLQILSGQFDPLLSDKLVHMSEAKDDGEYMKYEYDIASPHVWHRLRQHVMQSQKVQVLDFLQRTIELPGTGTVWGRMYEPIALVILSRGGSFKRKRVSKKDVQGDHNYPLKKLDLKRFNTLQDLKKLKADFGDGVLCVPSSGTFESVDAVILPNTFVKYGKGNHGYKFNGLKNLDKELGLQEYNLWACVPQERFEATKYQNLLTAQGTVHQVTTREDKMLEEKLQQYVVEVNYGKYDSNYNTDWL